MVTEKLKEIATTLCEAEEDAQKSEKGNISAGRRLRKVCMEAINQLKNLRKTILENSKK